MRMRHLSLCYMNHMSCDMMCNCIVDLGHVEGVSSAPKVAGAIWIDDNDVWPLSGPEIGAMASEMSPDV
jgi:hypothetical protein